MTEPDAVIGGRYRLIRRIGRGGMGEVWLAQDELLDRQVAVKRLLTGEATTDDATTDDLDKLLREARLAARLNHPNAVAVFDVVVESGSGRRPDVVMEYVPGDTLADQIKRRGRIPVDEVQRIGAAIADALAEAHRLGIVHRDLKPANIMVTDRGVPKLTDFGIARLDGDGANNTVTGFMLGTPAFLAPEIARGGTAEAASDVWSLGITLYAALDGHSPFQTSSQDNTLAILSRVVTSSAPPPQHGGELTPVIMRMIAGNPRERPLAHEAAAMLRSPGPARWSGPAASGSTLPRPWPPGPQQGPPPGPQQGPRHGPNPNSPSGPLAGPQSGPHAAYPGPPAYQQAPATPRPTPPPAWPPGALPGPPPPRHPAGSSGGPPPRTRRYVLAGGAALVAIAAVVGIVIAATSGGGSPQADPSSTSVTRSATTPTDVVSTIGSSTAPASVPVAGSGRPSLEYDEQVYRGPGGIAVAAPSSWTADDSAGIASVRDFRAPGAVDIRTGSFFRIGIGNARPASDIKKETAGTVDAITSSTGAYRGVKIIKVTYVAGYHRTTAADIEFTGTNSADVARHVKLRIWIEDGHTLEIELNSPTALYSLYSDDVFPRLVDSCVVSD